VLACCLLPVAEATAQTAPIQASCEIGSLWLRGDFGVLRFGIDLADTPESRARGLMHVTQLSRSRAMLFVYPEPQEVAFWMKNTLIPLDIIFVDDRGVVGKVHENAIPGDLTPIYGGGLVKYVLEINGGQARQLGISKGTQLRHPLIERAAWPC
jgi:uncharacterized membrane protein (UPF0127 family)